jgi:hypothetical protein
MKATISLTGVLDVIPETSTEAYALSQWWRNYDNGNRRSALHVRVNPEPIADAISPSREGDFDG